MEPDRSAFNAADPSCPFCEHKAKTHWRRASFYRCSFCGLMFRYPLKTDGELNSLYGQAWERPEESTSETGGTEMQLARTYTHLLATTLKLNDFNRLKICDYGAGRGAMAQALTEMGAQVYAVEPFGYEYLASRGFDAYKSLLDIRQDILLDGAVSVDVLEHLSQPWRALIDIRGRLKPGGWVCLSTPNPNSLNAILLRDNWREARRAGHLMLIGPNTLGRMLNYSGFADYRRLKWYIGYRGTIAKFVRYALQAVKLDGEVRYLAVK